MGKATNSLHFNVHPSVVYQLGERLITDSVQALIELVKNCYDADATYAKITIDTEGVSRFPFEVHGRAGGRIIIQDNGNGMTKDAVSNGWLLISNRTKRELKEKKETTDGGRTPLGDKGLGRLGVQRLGSHLDILTKAKTESAYHIAFSWSDFATASALEDVDIHFAKANYPAKPGTVVVVSDLREPQLWKGQDSIKRLEQELSRMISPYKEIRDFVVVVEIDGKELELTEITDKVRSLAPIRYKIDFNGSQLRLKGRARLDFFRPSSDKEAEEFSLLAEYDNGDRFFDYLMSKKEAKYLNLDHAGNNWFVRFDRTREFEDLDALESDPNEPARPANPGPFRGEVDAFDLGAVAYKRQSVFDRQKEYRAHIKDLSGIRIYRDGFAIRVDKDWLKLGGGWTSARSYYGLKPDTTLGYVALSARENMQLEETTNREGFSETPFYRNFYSIMMDLKRFANEAQTFFGRAWADFKKVRHETLARVDTRKSIESIAHTVSTTIADASTRQHEVDRFASRLATGLTRSQTVLEKLATVDQVSNSLQAKARETFEVLHGLADESNTVMERVSDYLHQLQSLRQLGVVLDDRVANLRRQVDDMYETVALGLTAEAISHEVFRIADNLAKRTKTIRNRLNSNGGTQVIDSYLEHVHGSVMALRKQVSFLSPSLAYVREIKEDVNVVAFLSELEVFYHDRLAKNSIRLSVKQLNEDRFNLWINRGKLSQIFDNFILNSEYWLKQDIAAGRFDKGEIVLEVDRPFVRISDSGRGIDPSVEAALFEPFISSKARGEGRGLGLFIVKQLLDSEGCHVGILPERNRSRRLYKFQIDLRGALDGK